MLEPIPDFDIFQFPSGQTKVFSVPLKSSLTQGLFTCCLLPLSETHSDLCLVSLLLLLVTSSESPSPTSPAEVLPVAHQNTELHPKRLLGFYLVVDSETP